MGTEDSIGLINFNYKFYGREQEEKKVRYRELGNTGLKVSEIGMGCEGFLDQPYETVTAHIRVI